MNYVRESATGAGALLRRDILLFLSYRTVLVSQIAAGFFTIALFYYISRLVTVSAFARPDDYFAFAVIGVAIMEVVASTLSALPLKIRQELIAATFERLVVSPFGAVSSIVAATIFPFAVALFMGTSSLVFAALVFGLPLDWSTAPFAIPAGLLAAAAFLPFALLVTAIVLAFKQALSLTGFLVTGLSLVGGFFFPISLLPGWIRWLSDVQPFTPAVELLRHLLVDTPMTGSPANAVIRLVLFAVVLLPVGIWAIRTAIRYGQRKGTVTEY